MCFKTKIESNRKKNEYCLVPERMPEKFFKFKAGDQFL